MSAGQVSVGLLVEELDVKRCLIFLASQQHRPKEMGRYRDGVGINGVTTDVVVKYGLPMVHK